MAVGNLSTLFLVGFVVGCVGLVLLIIGVSTNEWETNAYSNYGLWKICNKDICISHPISFSKVEACQAFGIIGILTGGFGLLLALVQILFSATGKSTSGKLPLFSFCFCVVAGVAIFICIVVWGATVHDEAKFLYNVGYSYILSIIANALIPAGGFLLFVGGKS